MYITTEAPLRCSRRRLMRALLHERTARRAYMRRGIASRTRSVLLVWRVS